MITPEPMAPPCWVVTLTSTMAGRTLASTASRTACSSFPVAGRNGAILVIGLLVVPVLLNCQPAKTPTASTANRAHDNAKMAPLCLLGESLGCTDGIFQIGRAHV